MQNWKKNLMKGFCILCEFQEAQWHSNRCNIYIYSCLKKIWGLDIHQYINISTALLEGLENLLPARVMCKHMFSMYWVRISSCGYMLKIYIIICTQRRFLKFKPSHNALHICIYWYRAHIYIYIYIYMRNTWKTLHISHNKTVQKSLEMSVIIYIWKTLRFEDCALCLELKVKS